MSWEPDSNWIQKHSRTDPVGVTAIELRETHQVNHFYRLLCGQEGLAVPRKGELKLAGRSGRVVIGGRKVEASLVALSQTVAFGVVIRTGLLSFCDDEPKAIAATDLWVSRLEEELGVTVNRELI
jgi:hypothetical protein